MDRASSLVEQAKLKKLTVSDLRKKHKQVGDYCHNPDNGLSDFVIEQCIDAQFAIEKEVTRRGLDVFKQLDVCCRL